MSEEAKKCRYCGATLLGKGKFCVECGKSTEPEKTKCPECGFEIEGKIKFCPDCGHAFASVSSADYVRIPETNYGKMSEGNQSEKCADYVRIPEKNFCMGKYTVTQELYERVMGENPSEFNGKRKPVECVSWYDAIVFCNKLSKAEGKSPVYSVYGETDTEEWGYIPHEGNNIEGNITQNLNADGYRLPTKDEWHYAARGGENYTYAGSENIDEVAWFRENSNHMTHDVGQKKPNGYGLYDMSGNVWEWCWGSYADGERYFCGGSWSRNAEVCEVSSGFWNSAAIRCDYIGFRLVCKA